MKIVTREELDWLAEGELDQDEQQALFERLDRHPEGWKRCAFALLEQRALQASMNSLQESNDPTLVDHAPAPESRLPDGPHEASAAEHERPGGAKPRPCQRRQPSTP